MTTLWHHPQAVRMSQHKAPRIPPYPLPTQQPSFQCSASMTAGNATKPVVSHPVVVQAPRHEIMIHFTRPRAVPFIRRNTKIDRQREMGLGWRNNEGENDYRGMRGGHGAEEGVRDRSEVKESVESTRCGGEGGG